MQALDRPGLQAVAILQPFRNEVADVALQQLQGPAQHHGGADPVRVVVAVHGDRLPAGDGAQEPLRGPIEIGEA